jgi:hypothetical protein
MGPVLMSHSGLYELQVGFGQWGQTLTQLEPFYWKTEKKQIIQNKLLKSLEFQ